MSSHALHDQQRVGDLKAEIKDTKIPLLSQGIGATKLLQVVLLASMSLFQT